MARWDFSLELDTSASQPIFVQVAWAIAEAVRSGRLAPGARLPSTRELARELSLNRNTVTAAFRELQAEGWIVSEHGRGSFVSRALPEPEGARLRPKRAKTADTDRPSYDLSLRATEADEPVERGVVKWDFGLPDVRLAPTDALARAYRRALRSRSASVLQYTRYRESRESPLSRELGTMLGRTRGLTARANQIVVTHGSQMALYLVARALIRPGDVVAVEDPGYYFAKRTFETAGARVITVPVDHAGLDVDALAASLRHTRLRAVFVTPHHQFPTTVALSPGRRIALRRLAAEHRFAIIEDDFDHEFHYDGRPLLPLASDDPARSVVYIGSLSKVVAPGVRVGYVVAPPAVTQAIEHARQLIDPEGNQALEAALVELMEDGELQRHLNRARRIYVARRDHLVERLRKSLDGALAISVPPGGMALWARVDHAIDVEDWARRARERSLIVRTARIFYADGKPRPFLRLGFARLDEREISVAVTTLARALRRRTPSVASS